MGCLILRIPDEILPIFKRFEDNEFGPSPTRGVGGPLHAAGPGVPGPHVGGEAGEGAAGLEMSGQKEEV